MLNKSTTRSIHSCFIQSDWPNRILLLVSSVEQIALSCWDVINSIFSQLDVDRIITRIQQLLLLLCSLHRIYLNIPRRTGHAIHRQVDTNRFRRRQTPKLGFIPAIISLYIINRLIVIGAKLIREQFDKYFYTVRGISTSKYNTTINC